MRWRRVSKIVEGLGYLLDVRLDVVVAGEVVVEERADSRVLGEVRSHSRSLVLPVPPPHQSPHSPLPRPPAPHPPPQPLPPRPPQPLPYPLLPPPPPPHPSLGSSAMFTVVDDLDPVILHELVSHL